MDTPRRDDIYTHNLERAKLRAKILGFPDDVIVRYSIFFDLDEDELTKAIGEMGLDLFQNPKPVTICVPYKDLYAVGKLAHEMNFYHNTKVFTASAVPGMRGQEWGLKTQTKGFYYLSYNLTPDEKGEL